MTKIYWLWFGGSSYANPESDDYEAFATIRDAKETFASRLWDDYYPAVSQASPEEGGPEALLFRQLPTKQDYPDARLFFGPRGGIRLESC